MTVNGFNLVKGMKRYVMSTALLWHFMVSLSAGYAASPEDIVKLKKIKPLMLRYAEKKVIQLY